MIYHNFEPIICNIVYQNFHSGFQSIRPKFDSTAPKLEIIQSEPKNFTVFRCFKFQLSLVLLNSSLLQHILAFKMKIVDFFSVINLCRGEIAIC
jgi:hypothetical protein